MKVYNEDDYLMISGIQHYAFCPRQWALIHLEDQWEENYLTTSGRIMHAKAHDGENVERRGSLIIFRSLRVVSSILGISGVCDVVEFYESSSGIPIKGYPGFWIPYPVEYKRGKSKLENWDRLQLCAQAVCLEEMLCTSINKGAIYYGEPRRREIVEFTEDLRLDLCNITKLMHKLYITKHTPKAVKKRHCNSCSVKGVCLPNLSLENTTSAKQYMEANLK